MSGGDVTTDEEDYNYKLQRGKHYQWKGFAYHCKLLLATLCILLISSVAVIAVNIDMISQTNQYASIMLVSVALAFALFGFGFAVLFY